MYYPTGEGTAQRMGEEGRIHCRSLHQRSRAAERGVASVERLVGRLASLPLLARDYERVFLDRSRRFVVVVYFFSLKNSVTQKKKNGWF